MIVKELFTKLGLQFDESGFLKAESAMAVAKKGLKGLAGLAVAAGGALWAMAVSTANTGDNIDELAQITGVGRSALQELAHAASFSGVGMEGMATTMSFLNKQIYSASKGSKGASEAFSKLGVKIRREDGTLKTADEVLEDIADKVATMPDGAEKAALTMQVLGRSGKQLIPMLNGGSESIRELREEAKDLGVVLDDETIDASVAFKDNLDTLHHALTGVKNAIASQLLKALSKVIVAITTWIKENRKLIASGVAKFAMVFGAALNAVGGIILWVIRAVMGFINILRGLWSIPVARWLMVIVGAIALVKTGMVSLALTMVGAWLKILGPIAAVMLLLEDIYVWSKGGESLLGDAFEFWGQGFGGVVAKWKEFWQEFTDWLSKKIDNMLEDIGEMKDSALNMAGIITDEEFEMRQNRRDERRKFGITEEQQIANQREGKLRREREKERIAGERFAAQYGSGFTGIKNWVTRTPQVSTMSGMDGATSSVQVNAAPIVNVNVQGGDPSKVGTSVRQQLDEWWQSTMRTAKGGAT